MAWNFGNTSVRNPWRIQDGLRVFATEFNGNLDGTQQEELLIRRLSDEGIVDTKEPSDWHGRKWRSCFTKLGFATYKDTSYSRNGYDEITLASLSGRIPGLSGQPYELTPSGAALLEADTSSAVGDVFLRQLLRLEIPSPTEQERPIANLKPFVFLLQVLHRLRDLGRPGLTQEEIAIFIQTAQNHDGLEARVDRLHNLRTTLPELVNATERTAYRERAFERERIGDSPSFETHRDYADTTIRYARVTGLLTQQGKRSSLREERLPIVESILQSEPDFLVPKSPEEYLVDFYTGTRVPTDDEATALREVEVIQGLIESRGKQPVSDARDLGEAPIQDIRNAFYRLEEQYLSILEQEFAKRQRDDASQIQDIVDHLHTLDGGRRVDIPSGETPAYLEWTVWRGLLALDHLAVTPSETRMFKLDTDLLPIHHAPGGGPDMLLDYPDYLLVGEVTLRSGSKQEAAEGETVRRHVAEVAAQYHDRDVYGIFVAPRIDLNTAETFRVGNWYVGEQPAHLHIVPLTISQFSQVVQVSGEKKLDPTDLRALLIRCLAARNASAPIWLDHINNQISRWTAEIMG